MLSKKLQGLTVDERLEKNKTEGEGNEEHVDGESKDETKDEKTVRDSLQKVNNTFKCPECHYCMKQKGYVINHLVKIHGYNFGPVFKCEQCPASFRAQKNLNMHVFRVHKKV